MTTVQSREQKHVASSLNYSSQQPYVEGTVIIPVLQML